MNDLIPHQDLEAQLLALPQLECPPVHHFGAGIYAREVTYPADSFVMGHSHKGSCLNMLLKGSMRIIDPDGNRRVIEAPMIFTSGPGRKVGHTLTDVTFINLHATDLTDLDALEDALIEKSDAWLAHTEQQIALLKAGDQ